MEVIKQFEQFEFKPEDYPNAINYLMVEGIDGVGKTSFIEQLKKDVLEEYGDIFDVHVRVEPDTDSIAWQSWLDVYNESLKQEDTNSLYLINKYLSSLGLSLRHAEFLADLTTFKDSEKKVLIIKDRSFISGLVYQFVGLPELVGYVHIYHALYSFPTASYNVLWLNKPLEFVLRDLSKRDSIVITPDIENNFKELRRRYITAFISLEEYKKIKVLDLSLVEDIIKEVTPK